MTSPGLDVSIMSPELDPLLIIPPSFWQRDIAQHNPLRNASNMLTLTLIPNFFVASGSNITVSGLAGTLTVDTPCLNISGAFLFREP
jgi:hypothetical protein